MEPPTVWGPRPGRNQEPAGAVVHVAAKLVRRGKRVVTTAVADATPVGPYHVARFLQAAIEQDDAAARRAGAAGRAFSAVSRGGGRGLSGTAARTGAAGT